MAPTDPVLLIQQIGSWLSAVAVAMSRPAGAAIVLPVFTRAQLGGPVRGAFAFALGIPVVPTLHTELLDSPHSLITLGLINAKELVIGIMIGLFFGLPIWAVQSIGELLDTQRSATQGQSEDPTSGNQDSTTAGFLAMVVIALFVLSGGLNLLSDTLITSDALWPPLTLNLQPRAGFGSTVLGLLDRFEVMTLTTGAPVMLAMLLCEASVILLMRSIPKLHLYDLAPTLRNLAFIFMMSGYCTWLVTYMRHDLAGTHNVLADMQRLLVP